MLLENKNLQMAGSTLLGGATGIGVATLIEAGIDLATLKTIELDKSALTVEIVALLGLVACLTKKNYQKNTLKKRNSTLVVIDINK